MGRVAMSLLKLLLISLKPARNLLIAFFFLQIRATFKVTLQPVFVSFFHDVITSPMRTRKVQNTS